MQFKSALQAMFLGILLLLCLPSLAQNAEVSGHLHRNGSPLDFVVIKLQDGAGRVVNATLTNDLGAFEFTDLQAGSYSLVGEYKGFPIHAKVMLSADAHVVMTITPSIFRWVPETSKPEPKPISPAYTSISCKVQWDREDPRDRLPTRHTWIHNDWPKIGAYDNQKPRNMRQEPLGITAFEGGVKIWGIMQPTISGIRDLQIIQSGIPAEYGDAMVAVLVWHQEPILRGSFGPR